MVQVNQEEIIAEIKRNNDIVSVVSEYVSLKERGRSYLGLCPFHQEKTPSFTVSREKQLYHCFGCGAGGDVINFLMELEHLTFPQALQHLAERANLSISLSEESSDRKRTRQEKEWLFRLHQFAALYYQQVLTRDPLGAAARGYLEERGINQQSIKRFFLGYAPPSWTGFVGVLQKKGIPLLQAEKAGLIIGGADGFYSRFRDRIIFPIMTAQGRVAAFGARIMGDGHPKYLNSPDTPVFHKGKYLYGLYQGREAIRAQGKVVMVEGYMDVIQAHQYGIEYVVASLGTALTRDQIKTLKRYTQKVVMAYDADSPGEAAALRGLDLLRQEGLEVWVAALPRGEDPDSLIRREGPSAFIDRIEQAKDLFTFKLEYLLRQNDYSTPEGKAKTVKMLLPLLAEIPSMVARETYIKIVGEMLDVSEESIYGEWRIYWHKLRKNKHKLDIKNVSRHTKPTKHPPEDITIFSNIPRGSGDFQLERELLRGCLQEKSNLERITVALCGSAWSNSEHQFLFEELRRLAQTSEEWPPAESKVRPDLRGLFTQILAENEMGGLRVDLAGCCQRLRQNQLIREIQQIQKEVAATATEEAGISLSSAELQEKLVLLNKLHRQLREEFPMFSGLI